MELRTAKYTSTRLKNRFSKNPTKNKKKVRNATRKYIYSIRKAGIKKYFKNISKDDVALTEKC